MEAFNVGFNVGDVIAPHYGLRLFDKHNQSYLFHDTDVAIVLTVQKRLHHGTPVITVFDITLLHGDGQIRQHAPFFPELFKIVIDQ